MKKLLALLLAVCMCFAACITLASCDKHTHTFKSEWDKDATHHWHVCEGEGCTEVADKAEHTWNEGEITTAATHGADGVKTFTCTACAATKTEAVQGDFTVTAEEWAYALNFLNYDNFTCTANGTLTISAGGNQVDEYIMTQTVMKNGTDIVFSVDVPAMQQNMTQYYYVKGDKYYQYQEEYQENYEEISIYYIDTLEHDQIFSFSNFVYNEATGAYEAAEVVYDGEEFGEEVVIRYINCSFKFLDGKLISMSYTSDVDADHGESGSGPISATITYGTAPASIIPANLHRPS